VNHAEFQILLALADGDRHGYGIMREIEAASQGAVRLGPGTLYGTIKRMLRAELIEKSATRPAPRDDDDRRRSYYGLTQKGRTVVTQESERLAALVHVAETKRVLRGRAPRLAEGSS
jgi:DNA-binding PadR family transcriptional regulator